jgi:hypothetical protein
MLIRRDGLMATPYGTGHDILKVLSAKASAAGPSAGYTPNPLQQHEAKHREDF